MRTLVPGGFLAVLYERRESEELDGGRYWDRTSDPYDVNVAPHPLPTLTHLWRTLTKPFPEHAKTLTPLSRGQARSYSGLPFRADTVLTQRGCPRWGRRSRPRSRSA